MVPSNKSARTKSCPAVATKAIKSLRQRVKSVTPIFSSKVGNNCCRVIRASHALATAWRASASGFGRGGAAAAICGVQNQWMRGLSADATVLDLLDSGCLRALPLHYHSGVKP